MHNDHEFDPITPEELAQIAQEEELARKIRREVRRMNSGDASEDIKIDKEQEQQQHKEHKENQEREKKRASSTFRLLISGNILVWEGIMEYYRYLICIAIMFFVSIFVMFTALHLDVKYTRTDREVQLLRERSIRLQEQRYNTTTHSAITEQLRLRGINIYDPPKPGEIIED